MITLTIAPPKGTQLYGMWTDLKDGFRALAVSNVDRALVYCRPKISISTITSGLISLLSGKQTNECENLAKYLGLLGEVVNPVYGYKLFFVYGSKYTKGEIRPGAPVPPFDDNVIIPIPYRLPENQVSSDFNIVSPFVILPEILARAVIVTIRDGYYVPKGSNPDEIRKEITSNIPTIIRSNPMFLMSLDEVFRELGLDAKDQEVIMNNAKLLLMKNLNTIMNIIRKREQGNFNPLSI